MKTLLTTFSLVALTLIGSTPLAQARNPYRQASSGFCFSGYRSCETSVHTERYWIGYDRCGNPVWGYRTVADPPRYYAPVYVPPVCPPRIYYNAPVCPPPRPYYRGYGDRCGPGYRTYYYGR